MSDHDEEKQVASKGEAQLKTSELGLSPRATLRPILLRRQSMSRSSSVFLTEAQMLGPSF